MANKSETSSNEIAEIFTNEDEKLVAYGIKTISKTIAVIFICFFGSLVSCSLIDDLTSSIQSTYVKES